MLDNGGQFVDSSVHVRRLSIVVSVLRPVDAAWVEKEAVEALAHCTILIFSIISAYGVATAHCETQARSPGLIRRICVVQ